MVLRKMCVCVRVYFVVFVYSVFIFVFAFACECECVWITVCKRKLNIHRQHLYCSIRDNPNAECEKSGKTICWMLILLLLPFILYLGGDMLLVKCVNLRHASPPHTHTLNTFQFEIGWELKIKLENAHVFPNNIHSKYKLIMYVLCSMASMCATIKT